MHRVAYLCGAGAVACALFILLSACGGGDCDAECRKVLAQAHGDVTVEPVVCAASSACTR